MNRRERNILMGAENFDPNDRVECLLAVFSASGRQAIRDAFLKCAHIDDTVFYAFENGVTFDEIPNPTIATVLDWFWKCPDIDDFFCRLSDSFKQDERIQRVFVLSSKTNEDLARRCCNGTVAAIDRLLRYDYKKPQTFIDPQSEILKDDTVRSLFISLLSPTSRHQYVNMTGITLYDSLRLIRNIRYQSPSAIERTLNACPFKDDDFFRVHVMILCRSIMAKLKRMSLFSTPRTLVEHLIINKNCSFPSNINAPQDVRQAVQTIWEENTRATFESLPLRLQQSEDVQMTIAVKEDFRYLNEWVAKFKRVGMSDHMLILFTCVNDGYLIEWQQPSAMRQLCLTYSTRWAPGLLYAVPNLTFIDVIIIYISYREFDMEFVYHCPDYLLSDENLRIFLIGKIKTRQTKDIFRKLKAVRPFSLFEMAVIKSRNFERFALE